jgi:hypothetical protein
MKHLLILAVLLFASAAIVRAEPPSIDSGLLTVSGQPATLATTAPLLSSLNISGTTFSANTLNASIGTLSATLTPPGSGCPGCTYSQVTGGTIGAVSCATDAADFTVASGGAVTTSTAAGTSLNVGTYGLCYQVAASGATTLQGSTSLTASSSSVPAPAAAAGFNTQIASYDFTSSAYANPATWLDCKGASPYQWSAGGAYQPTSFCASDVITTDPTYGGQVLDIQWNPSDYVSGNYNVNGISTMGSNNTYSTSTFTMPSSVYIEVVARSPTANYSACPTYFCIQTDAWSWAGNGSDAFLEYDFIETYSNNGTPANTTEGVVGYYGGLNMYPTAFNHEHFSDVPGFDASQYNTFGIRQALDNSGNISYCLYLNGTIVDQTQGSYPQPYKCLLGNYGTPQALLRDYLVLSDGPQKGANNYTTTTHFYVKSIKVWSCTSWNSSLANVCNVPTAEITSGGALTGPP